jgi:hypothetical protein
LQLLDDFEDVSVEEKTFMKLWNRHVHSTTLLTDSQVAGSCMLFGRRFAPFIVR